MAHRHIVSFLLGFSVLTAPALAREWKSANGKFSIEAEFVAVKAGKVQLKKENGEIIEVALNQLSDVDRKFVATVSKTPATAPVEPPAAVEGKPGKRPSPAEWLEKPLTFDFVELPLKDAMDSLNVLCVLDVKALAEAGITVDSPLTGKAKAENAMDSLNAVLAKLKLTAVLHHDVIFVTTGERLASLLHTRIYRLRAPGDSSGLIKQVTSQTAPQSWDNLGGSGSICSLGTNVIVISQTLPIHREIEKKHVRQLMPVAAPADKVAALVPSKGVNPLAKMREVLRRPSTADYVETPLKEVVAHLAKVSASKVNLDAKALMDAGVSEDTPITAQLKEVPLGSLLSLLCLNLGLTWTVDGDKILITSPEAAEKKLIAINYDVRDLTGGGDFDSLIDAITSTVHPSSWQDVGGPGDIDVVDGGLAIKQSVQVHRIIE
ncbi:MAG: SHD1 domain-containing protein, partial [Pirellulaceae bacterium]